MVSIGIILVVFSHVFFFSGKKRCAGKVVQHLVQAHSVVRNYDKVLLWARDKDKSKKLADQLDEEGYTNVESVLDLEDTVQQADVISCATLSQVISLNFVKRQ